MDTRPSEAEVRAVVSDLSAGDQALALKLVGLGQTHLLEGWKAGVDTAKRVAFFAALRGVDASYPDGFAGYIESARKFLLASSRGENPLEGYEPCVPSGVHLVNPDADTVRGLESAALQVFRGALWGGFPLAHIALRVSLLRFVCSLCDATLPTHHLRLTNVFVLAFCVHRAMGVCCVPFPHRLRVCARGWWIRRTVGVQRHQGPTPDHTCL